MAASLGGQQQPHHHHHHHPAHHHHHHSATGAPLAHLNRSLERVLEEAVHSGILNLSGRKLKEFPPVSYDLTDTVQADLSKNRFIEIPQEVCLFAPLETLHLYHNCIKCIPESVVNLQMLTFLNISRNLLSTLPKYLFNLPLKVLILSNNKLVSLPEEIGKLKDLMELDVSCNEIQILPQQMGKLHSLRELNIRRNHLQVLPEELAELPLVKLDFSCNKVSEIPICFRKLRYLQIIILDNNPMQSPPAQICLKGKVHMFKYLNIQSCRIDKKPDSLDLPSLDKRALPQPLTDSMEDFYPAKSHGPDSGIGSDNGDKRLSTTEPSDDDTISLHSQLSEIAKDLPLKLDNHLIGSKLDPQKSKNIMDVSLIFKFNFFTKLLKLILNLFGNFSNLFLRKMVQEDDELKEVSDLRKIAAQLLQQEPQTRFINIDDFISKFPFDYGAMDPGFTIRRKMEHIREELEVIKHLKQNLEMRLKVMLPEDVGAALMDGVVLCHLANHIRPRSVASIHVPSPAVPKLSMAKCRRNVENFLEACRKLGVPEDKLCLPHHILEERGLVKVGTTVQALLELPMSKTPQLSNV
uniref:Leucine rich repeats and calponin homology domain containing 2 n=1 Tax=Callorhinchus milii TaxID=7868 RepID=A0A4W3I6W0_CALMI